MRLLAFTPPGWAAGAAVAFPEIGRLAQAGQQTITLTTGQFCRTGPCCGDGGSRSMGEGRLVERFVKECVILLGIMIATLSLRFVACRSRVPSQRQSTDLVNSLLIAKVVYLLTLGPVRASSRRR